MLVFLWKKKHARTVMTASLVLLFILKSWLSLLYISCYAMEAFFLICYLFDSSVFCNLLVCKYSHASSYLFLLINVM